ncbi:MAG: hypothetical protein GY795_15915 [Desulfobacterales bacterium]|nr:hypothetical protein [Desulfobacterales bacterium]
MALKWGNRFSEARKSDIGMGTMKNMWRVRKDQPEVCSLHNPDGSGNIRNGCLPVHVPADVWFQKDKSS